MREHPHLELERELQRLTEALQLEREGGTRNLANASAWVRSWSVNAWLAPGISRTFNALSETFKSCSSYSMSGSRLSRLRRRAYGQTS